MNVERLIRLAELLEADAVNPNGIKFALDTWGHDAKIEDDGFPYDGSRMHEYAKDVQSIPVDCNTAACAMGLAAISGAFAAEGLTWRILSQFENGTGTLIPTLRDGTDGFSAAMRLFEIPDDAATQLFDPSYYDVIKGAEAELAVAGRIRAFVNGTWQPTSYDDGFGYED